MEPLSHPGIPDLDCVDLVGVRRDGGVDLGIVVSQPLDGSEQSQRVLLAKIENYLGYRNSENFRNEFGELLADQVCIVVMFSYPPDPIIIGLIGRAEPWVAENNARIRFEVDS